MEFKLRINTANAAFEGDGHAEVARILRELAERIENGSERAVTLRDANGNTVGRAGFGR